MGFFSAGSDYHTLRGCGVMFKYVQIVGAITAIVTPCILCIWCTKTEEPEITTDAMIAAAVRDHGAASGAPRETTPPDQSGGQRALMMILLVSEKRQGGSRAALNACAVGPERPEGLAPGCHTARDGARAFARARLSGPALLSHP